MIKSKREEIREKKKLEKRYRSTIVREKGRRIWKGLGI